MTHTPLKSKFGLILARRLVTLYLGLICCLSAEDVCKKGIIPSYTPHEFGCMQLFLPYNPNILIVGDKIASLAADMGRLLERASVYCVSSEPEDIALIDLYSRTECPNLHGFLGQFSNLGGFREYFPTLPHERPYEGFRRFAGSILRPTDVTLPFLYGEERWLPTYNLRQFCHEQKLFQIHLLYLNCGGNELEILRSDPELLQQSIVVLVKTYHQAVREGLASFVEIDEFMSACDFMLMSHYIYDDIIGDALYVKRKYFRAVFNIKEF